MFSIPDSNDTKTSPTEPDAQPPPHPEIDTIWHNMYAPSTFTTWRKQSTRSIEQLLVDFTTLVDKGVFKVVSLSVGKASFVAVVACERDWEEIEEGILGATR
ncbi:hypothetical protein KCU65_g7222, partial [Aureobasidium melanogenum]